MTKEIEVKTVATREELAHWSNVADAYFQTQSPLHPSAADIAAMEGFVEKATRPFADARQQAPLRALLLGVTPAIATMNWPPHTTLLAVDRAVGMLQSVWPGDIPGVREAQFGDWFALPVEPGSCTVVIGDGSINCVAFPHGYQKLAASVARVLADDGVFILRVYTQPKRKPTPTELFQELMAGEFHTFDGFKFLLNMALVDAQWNVAVQEVWQQWIENEIDEEVLCRITGWSPSRFSTIAYYQNSDARYSFPPLAEIERGLADHFHRIDIAVPPYPLGDCCPTLMLQKRTG